MNDTDRPGGRPARVAPEQTTDTTGGYAAPSLLRNTRSARAVAGHMTGAQHSALATIAIALRQAGGAATETELTTRLSQPPFDLSRIDADLVIGFGVALGWFNFASLWTRPEAGRRFISTATRDAEPVLLLTPQGARRLADGSER